MMYGRLSILLPVFLLLSSFSPGRPGEPPDSLLTIYHKADRLFHLIHSTIATDSMALAGFERVIAGYGGNNDTLLFQCLLKKGILLDARADFAGAKDCYCKALSTHPGDDSLAFVVYVYAGAGYYNLNIFDSANYFLLKAEALSGRFHDPEDNVRLYNTLGVLYHDNGNYQQAKNYFSQALEIVKGRKPFDVASAVSLKTNIATCSYRLGLYRESLSLYRSILAYRLFASPIYMNMGMAFGSLDQYAEALACYQKVDAAKLPGVLNEIAYSQLQLHRPDSAAWWLDQLQKRRQTGLAVNSLDLGINGLYRSDLLASRQQYGDALISLQKAIVLFSPNFDREDIFSNPADFQGTFACYRLFDALSKKGALFEKLFRSQPREEYLRASYDAYKAALSLLQYIEKSYDTDDAKIFLKKRTPEVYRRSLSVCLELYRRHPGDHYLEEAFVISDKNKASIIAANLGERELDKIPGVDRQLLQKERNIKYNIARLNVRRERSKDEKEAEGMAREKAGYEIELSRVQKKLDENSSCYRLKYDDRSPGIGQLQERLGGKQALVSFTLTTDALHVFVLTRSSLAYTRIDSLPVLQRAAEKWLNALKTTESGKRFTGWQAGSDLYKMLVKPIQALIPEKDEWILIPDGFLYFLPFESLSERPDTPPLLETTTVSYQFSSRFLVDSSASAVRPEAVAAFAPFAEKGGRFDGTGDAWFNPLRDSREEIAGLPGSQYVDSLATKQQFLKEIDRYPIVHLATHAVSSVSNAASSFIAFYPDHRSSLEDCLYLEELYGLDMKGTQLVVISACETGQGELVSNEGVISLARAFAYAGCASTISSLWKADDRATSFILRRFYVYLQKGDSKSKALQRAKLDYLRSDALNKSPAFWSHLVLTGNTEPLYKSGGISCWGLMAFPVGLVLVYLLLLYCTMRRSREDIRTTTS
ncbi:MAG: CHAT domain-containing tetratricopeptide repeat protein [Puia sp.]|nr:CHAT domain-containing tetratricopeptide repeat protein [Puia sp.]